ncbi:hypothetical protein D918_03328 [Trichuris suis]|nr:hypothetical protein D918_03328 [Trichuris suis]
MAVPSTSNVEVIISSKFSLLIYRQLGGTFLATLSHSIVVPDWLYSRCGRGSAYSIDYLSVYDALKGLSIDRCLKSVPVHKQVRFRVVFFKSF